MERIHATVFGTATERMLDLAEVRSGMHVLDVAAGVGGQTLLVAHRVGQQGQIGGGSVGEHARGRRRVAA